MIGFQPPAWSVPREWPGERCFVICGGESIRAQHKEIARLKGRIIAVKEGILLRPDADVMFLTSDGFDHIAKRLIPRFKGTYIVSRGKWHPEFPERVKRVTRTKNHGALCDRPDHVCGLDSGTSSINLARHFGSTEIVLLGYDMTGGRWFNGELPKDVAKRVGEVRWHHPMPVIPDSHFRRHLKPLKDLAADARAKDVRIVNCSPISRVDAFERQPLEAFL